MTRSNACVCCTSSMWTVSAGEWQGGAGPGGGFSWDDVVNSGERGKRAAEEAFYGLGDFFRCPFPPPRACACARKRNACCRLGAWWRALEQPLMPLSLSSVVCNFREEGWQMEGVWHAVQRP